MHHYHHDRRRDYADKIQPNLASTRRRTSLTLSAADGTPLSRGLSAEAMSSTLRAIVASSAACLRLRTLLAVIAGALARCRPMHWAILSARSPLARADGRGNGNSSDSGAIGKGTFTTFAEERGLGAASLHVLMTTVPSGSVSLISAKL